MHTQPRTCSQEVAAPFPAAAPGQVVRQTAVSWDSRGPGAEESRPRGVSGCCAQLPTGFVCLASALSSRTDLHSILRLPKPTPLGAIHGFKPGGTVGVVVGSDHPTFPMAPQHPP